jgi:hypothetical protein
MSVTPPVSHVDIWRYVASAAVGFESQASTAVRMLLSSAIRGLTVGAGVVGAGVTVGAELQDRS